MVAVSSSSDGGQSALKRGRPRALDEDRIVEAALRLARGSRLDDVSMRALAQDLDVPVMTVYNYVPNRDALYEMLTNHILAPVQVPGPEEGSWEDRLRKLERQARSAMAKGPGGGFTRRSTGAREAVRLIEGVMEILTCAGFGAADAALAFATLFTFMLGQFQIDASEISGEALEDASLSSRLSRDEMFEFAFDAVLAGLKAKLPSPRSG